MPKWSNRQLSDDIVSSLHHGGFGSIEKQTELYLLFHPCLVRLALFAKGVSKFRFVYLVLLQNTKVLKNTHSVNF